MNPLFHGAHRFDFFQLVFLLQRLLREGAPIGELGPYTHEKIRLRPHKSMSFQVADVQRLDFPETLGSTAPPKVTVNFMGLYGVSSPTPVYLTELLCFSDVDSEPLSDFLDLFNHRLLSLLFRAWLKYRFAFRYGRGGQDRFSWYSRAFVGMEDAEVCTRNRVIPPTVLRFLGLLCMRTRPPVGLRLVLQSYFPGSVVRIHEWVPRWVSVPAQQRNSVGTGCCSLGTDLTIGDRVRDRTGKFRIQIGPVGFKDFLDCLPDTESFAEVTAIGRLWVHRRLDFDVGFTVRAPEVPDLCLDQANPPRLGWTTWVTPVGGLREDPSVVFAQREAS